MKRQRGFTLIELTVAMAVLLVASGLIIIRVTGWSSRQSLHASARRFGNTVQTWRERARAEETTYLLTLEGRNYQISAGKEILRAGRLGSGEQFEGGGRVLQFTSRGILPETRITIVNGRGDRVSLQLQSLINEIEYREPG